MDKYGALNFGYKYPLTGLDGLDKYSIGDVCGIFLITIARNTVEDCDYTCVLVRNSKDIVARSSTSFYSYSQSNNSYLRVECDTNGELSISINNTSDTSYNHFTSIIRLVTF